MGKDGKEELKVFTQKVTLLFMGLIAGLLLAACNQTVKPAAEPLKAVGALALAQTQADSDYLT